MDLAELRKKIDAVDNEIVRLLNDRYRTVIEIGTWKKDRTAAVYVPEREKAVLDRLCDLNQGPMSAHTLRAIYREIMSGALSLEFPLRVSYLGPEATFTHQAAMSKFGKSVGYIPKSSPNEVFAAVVNGEAEYGCVPVENSTEGVVNRTLDMFMEWKDAVICAEINLPIHHCLLSKVPLSRIRKVYAHAQTLGQCRGWIRDNLRGVELVETASNTRGAELAAQDEDSAAIAPALAAEIYGLELLREAIEDNPRNTTRFLVISAKSRETAPTGADKTSICFAIKDRVGALYDSLLPFKEQGLTLSLIESRPTGEKNWEYQFFIDIIGHRKDEKVCAALNELEKLTSALRLWGSYPRAKDPTEDEKGA